MYKRQYWNNEINRICSEDSFYNDNVVGLSISSVVEKKCEKMGIPYKDTMVSFVNYLNESGYNVILIANAARINSEKSRNNDLMAVSYTHLTERFTSALIEPSLSLQSEAPRY